VELMIVVAVIGILSAVALPQYLKARARAEAGAAIGEAIGLAKECAVGQASKMQSGPSSCDGSAAGTFTASWSGDADGVRCLDVTIGAGVTSATVTATTSGSISCT
jgi:type IV pilus assembly protein PilA